jgi:hypothetical protein
MRLRQEHCDTFYAHFPEPESLTPFELLAVIALHEEVGIDYFVSDTHAVREEFGSPEAFRAQRSVVTQSADHLVQAS